VSNKALMKRPVETTEDFKARIAAIIGDKPERVIGARRAYPMLVHKKRVIKTQKRRRR
jgi:hypothetical protein